MDIKLFDSELKVMCVLWNEGDTTAKHISDVLKKEIGWNMNTTYTLIKGVSKKGRLNVPSLISCAMPLFPKKKYRKRKQKNWLTRFMTVQLTNCLQPC